MNFFDHTKSIVENAYLLCGPILAILSIAGVFQLILTKKALVINSKREAAMLASQQVEIFNSKVIPLAELFDKMVSDKKIEKVNLNFHMYVGEEVVSQIGEVEISKLITQRKNLVDDNITPLLNALDSFSIYFTKGVADEQIAYTSVGKWYCDLVTNLLFEISMSRRITNLFPFQNIIQLYKLWNERFEIEKLENQKSILIKKLRGRKKDKINPLGT